MARLRDPQSGCPWDLEQDFASIAPYTIEEAYEVADAIDRGDFTALRDELGDLLLQVAFHARMAEEAGKFDFDAVAASIADKMVRRHPHVFGAADVENADAQARAWEEHKLAERRAAGEHGVLDGVSLGLPALLRAWKLGQRASRVGFDWPQADGARRKVDEELAELERARLAGDPQAMAEEVGDLLFAVSNYARKLGVNPEEALRAANAKFTRRFATVEAGVRDAGGDWSAFGLAELDALWNAAKDAEPGPGRGD